MGKWQRRWYIWILFAAIFYPWTKWGNKIVFFVLFKMRSDGFLVKWKWGGYHFLQPNFQWSTHWQANSKTTATATATPPPSSLSPWAAPVKMVFIIALTIIINMIIPIIIIFAKNQVASLGTANNAAVLWPQLIAQAVAGIPGKYFFVKFETIWKWREFFASSSRKPFGVFFGHFLFSERVRLLSRVIQTIGSIVAILKWLPFYHIQQSLDIFQHQVYYFYKDFWKSFLGIKQLLLAKMKLFFLVS